MPRLPLGTGRFILCCCFAAAASIPPVGVCAAGEQVLYAFQGGRDGSLPMSGVISDASGNLYGTTYFGGKMDCGFDYRCGTFFKLAPDGTKSTLHIFCSVRDAATESLRPEA